MSAPAISQSEPTKPEQQGQWNVQVIRGKVTTRCLWNACKALSIGLLLLTLGTTMAIIGYYADQLSIRLETRGNSTVSVKNESRGFHLNNLSYAGPIVMGIGGFIVVAACVMTFEARDNAAKVVPARFKPNPNPSVHGASTKSSNRSRSFQRYESKRNTSCQTRARRDPGIHKFEPAKFHSEWSSKNDPSEKKAFTAAFVQLSRDLLAKSSEEESCRGHRKANEANLNKSPSAPDLIADSSNLRSPRNEAGDREMAMAWSKSSGGQYSGIRPLQNLGARSKNWLLRANHLQRQALSVDNSLYENCPYFTPPSMRLCRRQSGKSTESRDSFEMELGSSAGVSGSQTSMALDLHDCQVTLTVQDESAKKRSDTARRHQLLRQKPVEEDREDKCSKCSSATRLLFIPRGEDSSSLRTSRHFCSQQSPPIHLSKISAGFRSKSFSQCPTFRKGGCQEEDASIFCVEHHEKIVNMSSESIKMYGDETKKGSKGCFSLSPRKSPKLHECRIQRESGSECLIHPGSESARHPKKYPLVRSNATRRKYSQKIEGSLSAEEQCMFRSASKDKTPDANVRSASYSPIRNVFTSGSSSGQQSFLGSSPPVGDASPVASEEFTKATATDVPDDNNAETNASEEEKTCGIEPP